ncbi:hypothetical protein P8452_20418 [Trifolium repens]|nr:hypothetical protein P8452_20418 [Trifolium repens]
MRSLQRNMCDTDTGHVLYETMFVLNELLTRGIRNQPKNTTWTVALVYGFFKQDTLEISGREFILTLIARRSPHYAGTRYTPSMPRKQLFVDMQRERCAETESHHIYYTEHGDSFSCSNFVDLDWLSSSANSCEEAPYERRRSQLNRRYPAVMHGPSIQRNFPILLLNG